LTAGGKGKARSKERKIDAGTYEADDPAELSNRSIRTGKGKGQGFQKGGKTLIPLRREPRVLSPKKTQSPLFFRGRSFQARGGVQAPKSGSSNESEPLPEFQKEKMSWWGSKEESWTQGLGVKKKEFVSGKSPIDGGWIEDIKK